MPFKSKSQQRWMYANKPEMAKKWSDHTSDHKSLPEKSKKKKKRKEKKAALIALRKTAAMSNPLTSYEAPGGFEEYMSLPSGGASLGALLGTQGAAKLYGRAAIPKLSNQPPDSAVTQKIKALMDVYKKVPSRSVPKVFTDPSAAADAIMDDAVYPGFSSGPDNPVKTTRLGRWARQRLTSQPAFYHPKANVVSVNPGVAKDPHILAHELGHATQRKFLNSNLFKALRFGGGGASAAGNIGVLGTDDSSKAKQYALLANAGALPTLGYEAHASAKGSQLMKELAKQEGTWDKLKGLSKLKHRVGAWKGVPTYALAGLGLPWLTYAIKKSLGGYGKPKA